MAQVAFLNIETQVVIERSRVGELISYLVPMAAKPKADRGWELTGTGIKLVRPIYGSLQTVRLYTFVPLGTETRVVIEAHHLMDRNRWVQAFQRRRFEKKERSLCLRLLDLAGMHREVIASRDRKDAEQIVNQLNSGLGIR